METDNFLIGQEARDKVIAGARKVVDAVSLTLGPAGANFLAEHTLPPFQITSNDGVTLALSMELADPYERIGANIIKEVARKADRTSNDGTTTAVVLAGAIIDAGKDSTLHPMQLKRELEACISIVEKALKKQAKKISVHKIGKVATIAAEDESIGKMIQEIYEQIGEDGIIFNDTTRDFKDSYTLDKGVHIPDCGFASPYMGDMTPEGQFTTSAVLKNPAIVITRQKINDVKELEAIGNIITYNKRDLVIFADDVEGKVVNDLVLTRLKGGIRTVLIKLPIDRKDEWIEDIAKMTGATVLDTAIGITFKQFNENMFGTCAEIVVDKDNTFLDGVLEISEHIEQLKAKGDDDSLLRAAKLNKKTAKYHVGALSDQALKYRHDKVVDALGASYHALHGGIVAGGGIALWKVSNMLPDTEGGEILKTALCEPAFCIASNAGLDDIFSEYGIQNKGLNAKTGKIVNMFDANIIDAYASTFNSFKSAISVASTILTAHVVTVLPPEKPIASQFNPYGN